MNDKEEGFSEERKEALDKIDKMYEAEHNSNKRKLKYGIYCLFAVPCVFLVMLFIIDSSKLVFLVLWIASLFLISAYLVAIEYSDFRLQENFADILNQHREMESLLDVPDITDIDMSKLELPALPRFDAYRKERQRREEADANVALLMKQVAELTEKLDKMQNAAVESTAEPEIEQQPNILSEKNEQPEAEEVKDENIQSEAEEVKDENIQPEAEEVKDENVQLKAEEETEENVQTQSEEAKGEDVQTQSEEAKGEDVQTIDIELLEVELTDAEQKKQEEQGEA